MLKPTHYFLKSSLFSRKGKRKTHSPLFLFTATQATLQFIVLVGLVDYIFSKMCIYTIVVRIFTNKYERSPEVWKVIIDYQNALSNIFSNNLKMNIFQCQVKTKIPLPLEIGLFLWFSFQKKVKIFLFIPLSTKFLVNQCEHYEQ